MSWKSARRETTERRDPMQELCEAVIAELEKGVKPWVRPWDPLKCAGPHAPFNMATGHRYSGVNVIALGLRTAIFGSDDPRFCTYNQAQEHHWQVKKGEHGSTVFLYKPLEIEDEKAEDGKKIVPNRGRNPIRLSCESFA